MTTSREELRAWLDRWDLVAARQDEIQRATPPVAKLAQIDALRNAAADLQLTAPDDDLPRVRALWSRLRAGA